MKYILTVACFLFATLTYAQEAPRGVSQIILANQNSAAANMELISSILINEKHKVEFSDPEAGLVTSSLIAVEKTSLKIRLKAYCMDNKIVITGLVYIYTDEQHTSEDLIVNRGADSSPYLLSFNKMHAISGKIEGQRSYK